MWQGSTIAGAQGVTMLQLKTIVKAGAFPFSPVPAPNIIQDGIEYLYGFHYTIVGWMKPDCYCINKNGIGGALFLPFALVHFPPQCMVEYIAPHMV